MPWPIVHKKSMSYITGSVARAVAKKHVGGACCVLSCMGVVCCIVVLICLGLGIYFIYQPCSTQADCVTRDPCAIASCDGRCTYHRKENCCVEDVDCGEGGCQYSFCDPIQHVCRSHPAVNGTECSLSDMCTVDTSCQQGHCVGKTLTCSFNNPCRTGQCVHSIGCVNSDKPNGYTCNDNNPCTAEDACWNGMCAMGVAKDCSHLDSACTVGACDVTTGGCVAIPRNDGDTCDDGRLCTVQDVCANGVCAGTQNTCFDNNPCTVERCDESLGCVTDHTDLNETCIPGCLVHEDCPFNYYCYDGTCIQTQFLDNQQLRMIGYELEACSSETYRLKLHIVLDTASFVFLNEARYRVVTQTSDITPDPSFSELGFGDLITNLASNEFGYDSARTSFTMATDCVLGESNCESIFVNREFRFTSKVHDCIDISATPTGCIDPNHIIGSSLYLSISSCSMFPGTAQVIYPYSAGLLRYNGQTYSDESLSQVSYQDEYGYVGITTDIYPLENTLAVITDLRICQPNLGHHLGPCVYGNNETNCPNQGCHNWGVDSPILWEVDLVANQEVTALALSNTFLASGCYPNADYDASEETQCTWTKCTRLGIDDNFMFKFYPLFERTSEGHIFVFDIKYHYVYCGMYNSTRRLHDTNDKYALSAMRFV